MLFTLEVTLDDVTILFNIILICDAVLSLSELHYVLSSS